MDIGIQATLRRHDDPHADLDFYRDTRGFEVRHDAGSRGMRSASPARLARRFPGFPRIVETTIPPGRSDPRLQE
jgi:hypothetical protein